MSIASYHDYGQVYAEEFANGGYDEQTPLQLAATVCADRLRSCLGDWAYEATRRDAFIECRSEMAHAMAEDLSGVARNTWRYLRSVNPGTMQLTPGEVASIQAYNAAHSTAYHELDALDYAGLLAKCEAMAGERAVAA